MGTPLPCARYCPDADSSHFQRVGVAIMRAFAGLRRMLVANEALAHEPGKLERKAEGH